ncbi:hypothetical protein [Ochrovirga pacifica]|uniref:hypothetical protein n=1 Tax=Ochrovirga pacifica TaxID=1042376 RepID=UPI00135F1621|nr:hypothetical protein [Ochrovirga pacifica]
MSMYRTYDVDGIGTRKDSSTRVVILLVIQEVELLSMEDWKICLPHHFKIHDE